ncbi:MAG: hypothetical protein ACYTAS_06545 [Planctomycetota bacterium]|jgi:hypothetical protein
MNSLLFLQAGVVYAGGDDFRPVGTQVVGELTMDAQAKRQADDTSPEMRQVQYELYRGMSEAEKVRCVFETYRAGQRLAMTGIRMRHPEASEEEVRRRWAREHLGAELFDAAYGALSCE